jgi:flagellar export protein FliJ
MAFRFSLAAVLKYRENLEQREYLALEKTQQEIVQTKIALDLCQERRSAATRRREADLRHGITSVYLQADYEEETALGLDDFLEEVRAQLRQLQVQRQNCLKAYELARRNRELLDELRLRQLGAYRRAQAKREQATFDDVFLSRRRRGH